MPETLIIMTNPSEAGADTDPDVSGHDDIGEGMRPHAVDLVILVICIEVGLGPILAAAILPIFLIQTDLHSETDVSHVLDSMEALRRSLRLES